MTEVLPGEDKAEYTDKFNDPVTHMAKDSMVGSVGMPIGIQVVAPKWKDEQCLALMKVIDDSIGFKKKPDLKKIENYKC